MKDIVIVGAGGFGREVAWLVEEMNAVSPEWRLLGRRVEGLLLRAHPVRFSRCVWL